MNIKSNNHAKAALGTIAKICGVALAYYIAGRMSLLLAIPPGYASPVWPAAGIGLAAVLIYGKRVAIGVSIGSLFVNLWTSYDPSSTESIYRSVAIAGAIAAGAGLQALAGGYLIRRFVNLQNALKEQRDIVRFLILGAPVSCLINATIGISSLAISGAISMENFGFSWLNWWIGDAIGVFAFTPLALILFLRGEPIWSRRKITVAIPISLLFAMTVSFFVYARDWEQKKLKYEFSEKAKTISFLLEKEIYRHMEVLYSTLGLYVSSYEVTEEEFASFVKRPLSQNPGIQALSWNSVVKDRDRKLFENKFKDKGLEDFKITEKGDGGKIQTANIRDEYVVITYIEPLEKNIAALGYDVASNPARLEALNLARDSGKPIATAKITLVQDEKELNGLLVFLPVYKNGKPCATMVEKQTNISGYLVAVFKIDQLIGSSILELEKEGLNFYLIDYSAPNDRSIIYARGKTVPKNVNPDSIEKLKALAKPGAVWTSRIVFPGRNWELHITETQESILARQTWHVWFVLVIGVLFCGVMGGFLLIITGRKALLEISIALRQKAEQDLKFINENLELRIQGRTRELSEQAEELRNYQDDLEELVEKRTSELKTAQDSLIHSEKLAGIGKLSASIAHEFNNPICGIRNVLETVSEIGAEKQLAESDRKHVAMAIRECDRMADLIKKLQDFYRPSPEKATLINVHNELDDILLISKKRLKTRKILVEKDYGKDIPRIKAVADQIKQVLLNLIQNADDAIPEAGGKIDIATRYADSKVLIHIKDSGAGIDNQYMSDIFEPFFSTKPAVKGTGLGLSICHGIMKNHGGDIKVESAPGEGSTFTLVFPVNGAA